MELNVFERLLVRNIVPQIQGWNFGYMKQARELLENLFSPEEEELLGIVIGEDGKTVTWKTMTDDGSEIPQLKDVEISEGLQGKIKKFLEDMQAREQLSWEQYSLCEKFGLGE